MLLLGHCVCVCVRVSAHLCFVCVCLAGVGLLEAHQRQRVYAPI